MTSISKYDPNQSIEWPELIENSPNRSKLTYITKNDPNQSNGPKRSNDLHIKKNDPN